MCQNFFFELFDPAHHWLRYDDEKLCSLVFWKLCNRLIPLVHDFESSKLMVTVHVGDEQSSYLKQCLIHPIFGAKVIEELPVSTFTAVHHYYRFLAEDAY